MPHLAQLSLALVLLVRTAGARDFYVSSSAGCDAAAGDGAHPWRSLARVAREVLNGGDTVHLANADTWREPLVIRGKGSSCEGGHMRGDFERIQVNPSNITLYGWVVDPLLPRNGTPAVQVRVFMDGARVVDAVADVSRADLVEAGVAPNPQHGLVVTLPPATFATLQKGSHGLTVLASSAAPQCGQFSWRLPGPILSLQCVCDGKLCDCPKRESSPVRVIGGGSTTTSAEMKRPTIRLNGTGTAIHFNGVESVVVAGLEITHATQGITAIGAERFSGTAMVSDCVFRHVWNRSSVGQTQPHKGRDCTSGWSMTVKLGGFANGTVERCVFDDVDVAFINGEPPQSTMQFTGNTMTRCNGNTLFMTGDTEWLIDNNVFSRDSAPRFFMCGTTDIMIGGLGTRGTISENEIGWRGEHPASPDGCGIDYEGGSDGVTVADNLIHDSYGAGVMVFGLSDPSRNISNASLLRNIFMRNGAQQTSDDHGEIAFMEHGSTGVFRDNVFFADDTDASFVYNERRAGTLDLGWAVANNSVHPVGEIRTLVADTPAIQKVIYEAGAAHVWLESRIHPPRATTVMWSLDGSWPRLGARGTTSQPLPAGGAVEVVASRTAALNARFVVEGLPYASATMTMVVPVPVAPDAVVH